MIYPVRIKNNGFVVQKKKKKKVNPPIFLSLDIIYLNRIRDLEENRVRCGNST